MFWIFWQIVCLVWCVGIILFPKSPGWAKIFNVLVVPLILFHLGSRVDEEFFQERMVHKHDIALLTDAVIADVNPDGSLGEKKRVDPRNLSSTARWPEKTERTKGGCKMLPEIVAECGPSGKDCKAGLWNPRKGGFDYYEADPTFIVACTYSQKWFGPGCTRKCEISHNPEDAAVFYGD